MERALGCFERVVRLDPKFSEMTYKYMSSICIKRGDSAGAARDDER
jgi:hypothetical protein